MIDRIIERKLRKLNKFNGAKVSTNGKEITSWEVDGLPQPTQADLDFWTSEMTAEESNEKMNLSNAKKALMTKLGLNKQELKALIALIRDGSED